MVRADSRRTYSAASAPRHSPIWTFQFEELFAMELSGLEPLDGLSISTSKSLMHASRHREFSLSVGEHEQRFVFL